MVIRDFEHKHTADLHHTKRLNGKTRRPKLAPAYFSPNNNYFDQLLQAVKNETTILNLVFKGFLQILISPQISKFYASRFSFEIFLSHSAETFRKGTL